MSNAFLEGFGLLEGAGRANGTSLDEGNVIRVSLSEAAAPPNGSSALTLDRLISGDVELDNGGFIIPEAGWYALTARVSFYDALTCSRLAITVSDKSQGALLAFESHGDGSIGSLAFSDEIFLGKGITVGLDIYQNSGAPASLIDPNDPAYFTRPNSLTARLINPIVKPFSRKLIGVGDSLMAGAVCGADNVALEFLTTGETVNLGVNGTDTTTLAARIAPVIAAGGSDVDLIVHLGVNDLRLAEDPDIEVLVDRFETFFNAVRPSVQRMVYITPPPVSGAYANEDYVTNRTAFIAAMEAREIVGLRIARTDQAYIGATGTSEVPGLYPDKLHASALGQLGIAKVVAPHLR